VDEVAGHYMQKSQDVIEYVNLHREDFEREYSRMKQITAADQYNACKAGKIHKKGSTKRSRPREYDRSPSPNRKMKKDERKSSPPRGNQERAVPTTSSANQSSSVEDESREKSEKEILHDFKCQVVDQVRKWLNLYYPEADGFDASKSHRLNFDEYVNYAKLISKEMRKKIQDAYLDENRTLAGLKLTPDHKESIRVEVQWRIEH